MTTPVSARPPRRVLSERGTRVRATRQAEAVSQALADLTEFRSAQGIHAELRRRGQKVGLATVYRHLQALNKGGAVDMLRDESGEALYRRCDTGAHHHHLTCRSCGHSVEVEAAVIERWAEQVADEHGFTEIDHTVEIFGLCPGCARRDH